MKAKFKAGDKVRLVKGIGSGEQWLDDMEIGGEYVVTDAIDASNETRPEYQDGYIDVKGGVFTHLASQFEIVMPDVVTIVLRRPVDRKAIEKFLDAKGYDQVPDCEEEEDHSALSRIINVHFSGECKGERTYNEPVRYDMSTKQAIVENNTFMTEGYFSHKDIVVLKSKPSVKNLIHELKKYF